MEGVLGLVLRLSRRSQSSAAVRRAGMDLPRCRWVAGRSSHLLWGVRCCCQSVQPASQMRKSLTMADVDLLRHRRFHMAAGYSMFRPRVHCNQGSQERWISHLADTEVDMNKCALQEEPDQLRSSSSAKEQSREGGHADAKDGHFSREANGAEEQYGEHAKQAQSDTKEKGVYEATKEGQEQNAEPTEEAHLLDLEEGHLPLLKDATDVQEQNMEQTGEPHSAPGLDMEQMREAHYVPGLDAEAHSVPATDVQELNVEQTGEPHSAPGLEMEQMREADSVPGPDAAADSVPATDVEKTREGCLIADEEKMSLDVKEAAEEQNVEEETVELPIRRLSLDELKKKKGVRRLAEMMFLIQKSEKKRDAVLAKLKKMETDYVEGLKMCAASIAKDPVILSEDDRKALRKKGLRQKSYLPVGRRGIFGGTIENMHLHWKRHEVVKVEFSTTPKHMMRAVAEQLARLSGGILLDVVNRNEVLVYRGKNYERPPMIRPKQMISKRQALEKSILEQRVGDINRHIRKLQDEFELEAHNVRVIPSDVKMLLHDLGVSTEAELEKKRERRQRRLDEKEEAKNSGIPISDSYNNP